MGIFDHLQTKGIPAIQPKTATIRRIESKQVCENPVSLPNSSGSSRPDCSPQRSVVSSRSTTSHSSSRYHDYTGRKKLKPRKSVRNRASLVQHLTSSDDESDSEAPFDTRKRIRIAASAEPEFRRKIRSDRSFPDNGEIHVDFLHAADVTSAAGSIENRSAFSDSSGIRTVELQYPSAMNKEMYI